VRVRMCVSVGVYVTNCLYARDAWERAELEATKERESHERLVGDFQMLLDQKSKAQTDRMRELTERLDVLSSAADVAGPRGTHDDNNSKGDNIDINSKGGDRGVGNIGHGNENEAGSRGVNSSRATAPCLVEAPLRPPAGFSFADAATDYAAATTTRNGEDDRTGQEGEVQGGHGGGRGSGWEGDVMYEGGSEGVVAWSALNAGAEARRIQATREALGSINSGMGRVRANKASSATANTSGGMGTGPDRARVVMTTSGGFSGLAPGQRSGGGGKAGVGGTYGCTTERSSVAHERANTRQTNNH